MRELVKPLLVVVLVLVVPVLPFLVLGSGFEEYLERWLTAKVSKGEMAGAVFLLLASDIALPVPSSFVNTLAGSRLGILLGTTVSWLGMNVGATLGFALARWFGVGLLNRFANRDDIARLRQFSDRSGVLLLAVTRPIPVLAEAAVLLLGTTGLAWKPFFAVLLLSNLAVAFVYATLGWYSIENGQLVLALVGSITFPICATFIARKVLNSKRQEMTNPECDLRHKMLLLMPANGC